MPARRQFRVNALNGSRAPNGAVCNYSCDSACEMNGVEHFRVCMASKTILTTMATSSSTNITITPRIYRYLIARHGETNFNREHRVQGTLDESILTSDGTSQAAALGDYIASRQRRASDANSSSPPVTRTWCSPLQRCRQTYAAVVESCSSSAADDAHPLPDPTVHFDLREIELCEWQGRLRKEVAMEDATNWNVFKSNPQDLLLNNGSFAPVLDLWQRGINNWNAIRSDAASTDQKGSVFIMCHGGIGQSMLLSALGLTIDMYGKSRRYAFDNCDCFELEWAEGEDTASRWRRVHPVKGEWMSSSSARFAAGGLSCGR